MLEDVLSIMVKIDFFKKIILATNCPHAISIAGRHGITHFETGPDDGLSQAAGETVNHLLENGIRDMFLIPADIPLITEEEINSILRLILQPPHCQSFLLETSLVRIVFFSHLLQG